MANNWPTEQDLKLRLAALFNSPTRHYFPFVGTTYRFAGHKYSDRGQFTDGEGARLNGGRFTPTGGPRTLYLSLDRATAMAELGLVVRLLQHTRFRFPTPNFGSSGSLRREAIGCHVTRNTD